MSKSISNPYAKPKKAPPSRPTPAVPAPASVSAASTQRPKPSTTRTGPSGNTASNNIASTSSLATGFSFSQAFQAIEDTAQYKETAKHAPTAQQKEQAQQRVIDQQQELTDRQVHEFLPATHLLVSTKQRGNGLLQYIRNVPWQESRMVPDYIMGTTRCALFLSCKYHALHPQYIYRRLAELKSDFTLRILLVLVDEANADTTLFHLNKLAVLHNMTLILAWSEEEAARYLETYQAFVGKDASLIQKKKAEARHFGDQVADVLSKASTNKTDAAQLLSQFGTVKALAAASADELALVSGMGQVKVKRLHDAWHKPFSSRAAARRRKAKEETAFKIASGDDLEDEEEETEAGFEEESEHNQDYSQEISAAIETETG